MGLDNHNGHIVGENCAVFVCYEAVHEVECILHMQFYWQYWAEGIVFQAEKVCLCIVSCSFLVTTCTDGVTQFVFSKYCRGGGHCCLEMKSAV